MDYKNVNKKDTSAKISVKNPKISIGFGGTWGGKQEFSLKQPPFLKLVKPPKKSPIDFKDFKNENCLKR